MLQHPPHGGRAAAEDSMSKIVRVEILQVDLAPKVKRTDAIQSFVTQETPMVRITTDDGLAGTGYSYTIGTGGSSVVALIRDHLAPRLIGRDPFETEAIWKSLFFVTHATAVGAITSLALAAIDVALWDIRCLAAKRPLWKEAGGAQREVPLYSTEGGWLHVEAQALIDDALSVKSQGFGGTKIKVGRPHVSEDVKRLSAVREAVGPGFDIMTDANQAFTAAEAVRRARAYNGLDLAWFEEPLPAEDLDGHVRLAESTSIPIAVGESLYHPSHFREYLQRRACAIVQADVARIGGITPWLKVAHLAETFNAAICPHFLMEIHVSLCAAVPNAPWVEWIPQLDDITTNRMTVSSGKARPPSEPGIGIAWDWQAIAKRQAFTPLIVK
jgi:L-alanine-DL-glutamate epimerase-like enolase superfamily enzyme